MNGEAWKWRRRLFAWEELSGECIALLTIIVLQMLELIDGFGSYMLNYYPVSSAYSYLRCDG